MGESQLLLTASSDMGSNCKLTVMLPVKSKCQNKQNKQINIQVNLDILTG